ncbi:MAG: transglycosylase domain-containing protein [Pseudomonadota bacterium]
MGLWGCIAVGGVFLFYAAQLPSAASWAVPERPPNVRILADDGSLIANRGLTGGKALRLEDMSPYIPQAVIAVEDRRFHAHFGFDIIGFSRAMVRNITQRRLREGGSTLTQQLAKNLFLTPDRTFGRKIQELILAFWLESKYSKAEILELYLNRVYFGAGATGVDAASRRYFGKAARDVTIEEAALLAGLLKAPSRFTPAKSPKLANQRAAVVLRAMEREGYIKPNRAQKGLYRPGENARYFNAGPENFVADMVLAQVKKRLGKIDRDLVVKTTISPYLMSVAQTALQMNLDKGGKKFRVSEAALVSLAPDGAVKSLIGGSNYAKSQFNRAVDAKRQPGSAFKPFVWQAALEAGYFPDTSVEDKPVRIGNWQPANYDGRYRGAVTMEQALSLSLNTVSAQLTRQVGPGTVAGVAVRMGIGSKLTKNASISLGTSEVSLLELTSAYLPYTNGGRAAAPYLITGIRDDKRRTLYRRTAPPQSIVVRDDVLRNMNRMLVSVVEQGTARNARLNGHVAAGKTGTSQSFRDAVFVGHTAHFVTGVWFGNDNNSPTRKLTGGSLPARSWQSYMTTAHRGLDPRPLPGMARVSPNMMPVIPVNVATPTPRPNARSARRDNRGNQDLKERMHRAVNGGKDPAPRKSILDILLGRGES